MIQLEIDRLASAGIVRINRDDGDYNFSFFCNVPNHKKEHEVTEFLQTILNDIRDEIEKRKSWRFGEKRKKKLKTTR